MADSRIQDLEEAASLQAQDLLVLEQSSTAKKITGATLISDLAELLDGHGGISSITYTPPASGSLAGTLTINYADGSTPVTVNVTNGRGISNLTWAESGTAGNGRTHTGTFSYNDNTTSQVVIKDGLKGDTGAQTYVWIKWANVQPTSDNDMQDSPGPFIGIYVGLNSAAPTAYTSYQWYEYKGTKGDGIIDVTPPANAGRQGTQDTYTIYAGPTLADKYQVGSFTVYNGRDGEGQVVTVNEKEPTNGNVQLDTGDIYDTPINKSQEDINADYLSWFGGAKFLTAVVPEKTGGVSGGVTFAVSQTETSSFLVMCVAPDTKGTQINVLTYNSATGTFVGKDYWHRASSNATTSYSYNDALGQFTISNSATAYSVAALVITLRGAQPTIVT